MSARDIFVAVTALFVACHTFPGVDEGSPVSGSAAAGSANDIGGANAHGGTAIGSIGSIAGSGAPRAAGSGGVDDYAMGGAETAGTSGAFTADGGKAGMDTSGGGVPNSATAGAFAWSGSAGAPTAGESGGGVAGSAPSGRAGWDGIGDPDPTFVPACAPETTVTPGALHAVGAGYDPIAGLLGVIATSSADPGEVVGTALPIEGQYAWFPWGCHESLPGAHRATVGSLSNGYPEAFATTTDGSLFVQRLFDFWGPWTSMNLPASDSHVDDVAVSLSAEGRSHVYVSDRGRVFVRFRASTDAYSAYGPWYDVGFFGGTRIAVERSAGGRQLVFALTAAGTPMIAVQSSSELGAPFSVWSELGAPQLPPLSALAAGVDATQALTVYALDGAGELWLSSVTSADTDFAAWRLWDGPTPPVTLTDIAVAHTPSPAVVSEVLVGLGTDGVVYATRLAYGEWSEFEALR